MWFYGNEDSGEWSGLYCFGRICFPRRSPPANRTRMFNTLYIGAEKFPNRESFSVNISGILWKILFKHLWWRMWILVVRLIYFKFSKILHQIYWRYILKIINLYILSFKPWCVMPNCRISQFIQDSGEGKYTCFRTKKFSLDTTVSDELSYDDKKTSHAKKVTLLKLTTEEFIP